VNEFKNMRPFRPIIPTGPTYKQGGWIPSKDEIIEFMEVAKKLGLSGVNFWYWDGCRRYMPEYWDLIRDYNYETTPTQTSLPGQYIQALNSKEPNKVLNLYANNAVQISSRSAVQGKDKIRDWITALLKDYANDTFTLISQSHEANIYNFQWEVITQNGNALEGQDTMGVMNDKIHYHYSFTKPQKAHS